MKYLIIPTILFITFNYAYAADFNTNLPSPSSRGNLPKENLKDRAFTPENQSESEMDRTIVQRIRQEIMRDNDLSFDAKNVKVIVRDGKVYLRGMVKSRDEKINLAFKVRQIRGVTSLEDQLQVKEDEVNKFPVKDETKFNYNQTN